MNGLKVVSGLAVAPVVLLCLCLGVLVAPKAGAQAPVLQVTGLPCPGGQGEPVTTHPLIWQCLSGTEKSICRPWWNWQDTIPIEYGDVIAVTWFGECRTHETNWDFLRVSVLSTNQAGAWETNTTLVKMTAGYNFHLSYLYWYTNNGSLVPTNFDVAQVPVTIGSNQTPVMGTPASQHGISLSPPIWIGSTNAIIDPNLWPQWMTPGQYPSWPPWITNADGALVINPAAQSSFCTLRLPGNDQVEFDVQGLPGLHILETTDDLTGFWNETSLASGRDGTASVSIPLGSAASLFGRVRSTNPALGLGYNLRLETSGQAFEPAIYCEASLPQQFLWTWSDGTTSTNYPIASKDFGSVAFRSQNLSVLPPDVLTAINLGFDGSDGGENTPLTNRPPQNVSKVHLPYPLAGLRYFAASYNPITNTLDFTGFPALEALECFHCTNLQHAVVAHSPCLRRLCFEQCNLQELDLTDDPQLADVRAALNAFTNVTIGRGTGPEIWHWCLRDNPQLTQDLARIMTNFYSLKEPWFWNANQGGALTFISSNLTDVEVQENFYEFADFGGQTNLQICWINDNLLTNLVLTGCVRLQDLRAQDNQLTTGVLDSILAFLDVSAPDAQFVDLRANAAFPSAAGYTHFSNLTNRGVVVLVDGPVVNGPVVALGSRVLMAEDCSPPNNSIDPGENVTVGFVFRNTGSTDLTNLVLTLLETNGVLTPSAPVSYGPLLAGAVTTTQSFSFSAGGVCGGLLTATFTAQDASLDLGTVSTSFTLGRAVPQFTESFDGLVVPLLPLDWVSLATGAQTPWVTVASAADTAPNAVFAPDTPDPGVAELDSPLIALPAGPAQLSFRNSFDLERDIGNTADDGGVLEIQIGTNSFADILDADGSFVTGGYTATITNIWNNPLGGRMAWSGNSGGYVITVVNLPSAAAGQPVRFRWLCATDQGNGSSGFGGWRIDTISITGRDCCTNTRVSLLNAAPVLRPKL